MQKEISVFSTKAIDTLLNRNGEVISRQPGGPIFFIENVFKKTGIPFKSYNRKPVNVEILITDKGEFGRIPNPPRSLAIPFSKKENWIIVSTLLSEWNFSKIKNFQGKIFVDIQGFVRDGRDFGKKRVWEESKNFANKIFCLKGTKQEVSFLPTEVQESQKSRMLVVTDGKNGVDLFFQGTKTYIPVEKVVKTKDTIGAGDTFFAYFVVAMFQGKSPVEAAKTAIQKTSEFLERKTQLNKIL